MVEWGIWVTKSLENRGQVTISAHITKYTVGSLNPMSAAAPSIALFHYLIDGKRRKNRTCMSLKRASVQGKEIINCLCILEKEIQKLLKGRVQREWGGGYTQVSFHLLPLGPQMLCPRLPPPRCWTLRKSAFQTIFNCSHSGLFPAINPYSTWSHIGFKFDARSRSILWMLFGRALIVNPSCHLSDPPLIPFT